MLLCLEYKILFGNIKLNSYLFWFQILISNILYYWCMIQTLIFNFRCDLKVLLNCIDWINYNYQVIYKFQLKTFIPLSGFPLGYLVSFPDILILFIAFLVWIVRSLFISFVHLSCLILSFNQPKFFINFCLLHFQICLQNHQVHYHLNLNYLRMNFDFFIRMMPRRDLGFGFISFYHILWYEAIKINLFYYIRKVFWILWNLFNLLMACYFNFITFRQSG